MRMMRWLCSKISRERIRNEKICDVIRVAPIEDKFIENTKVVLTHTSQTRRCIVNKSGNITNYHQWKC